MDTLSQRYGLLPSECLARATTLDLYILDIGTKWVKYQQEQADLEARGIVSNRRQEPSQAEMMAMIERVKGQ